MISKDLFTNVVSSFTYDTKNGLLDNMDRLDLDPTDRIILMTQLAASRRGTFYSNKSEAFIFAVFLENRFVFCNSCGREGHATKKSVACEHYLEPGPSASAKSADCDEQANI
ncbi:hypothetical protein DM01DRAFT_1080376 [Hesseltinella vesiculosa]|uniref:Uncharacterized protein n=1 Tax=Hesseltinella vesiculosa TaxID=101127 RepID=A0A1X2GDS3_9FUNG|nr:hypothetical protein DM01DRAFT_1080376 [Hesseltinella vesiculosa]